MLSRPGVYYIKNLNNGRFYIGSSTDVKRRLSNQLSDLRANKCSNPDMQNDWNRGDKFTHGILIGSREDNPKSIEVNVIQINKENPKLYNKLISYKAYRTPNYFKQLLDSGMTPKEIAKQEQCTLGWVNTNIEWATGPN